jgi:hypothetical protein
LKIASGSAMLPSAILSCCIITESEASIYQYATHNTYNNFGGDTGYR